MAWIESHQSLGRHPKLLRLAARTAVSPAQAIGHLHYLWWWALEYAPDGRLARFSAHEIAIAAEWRGDPHLWFEALRETGWIDPDGEIHDWGDYAGKLAAERAKDRERKRAERAERAKAKVEAPPPAPLPPAVAPPPCPVDVQGTSAGNPALHNPTLPNPRVEEVEREKAAADMGMEVPMGFPKTEAEVVANEGAGAEFALKIWHLAASRGWRDAKGILIRNWRSYLAASRTFAKEAEARRVGDPRRERATSKCRRWKEIDEKIPIPLITA